MHPVQIARWLVVVSVLVLLIGGILAYMSGEAYHVVLLGDSIFDNEVYVKNRLESVTGTLEAKISARSKNHKVTNCAVDGAVMSGVERQIPTVPKDATHIFLSIIGNDCLGALMRLKFDKASWQSVVANPSENNPILVNIMTKFQKDYEEVMSHVLKLNKPLVVVSPYAPMIQEDAETQEFCKKSILLVGKVVKGVAARFNVPVIDLFTSFTPEDYANAIEPGPKGSVKIADAIMKHIFP